MPWNIILPTGISRCWQMRWERRKTPSCSVSGLWGISITIARSSVRFVPSCPTARSIPLSIRNQGENFEPSPGFHEGNAWNYTFYVPHDIKGLAKLMGGQKKFVDKLQMVFDKGYYDMANEPDIAYPYLFSYFKGEAWRTQKLVRELLGKYYHNAPNGLPGNDDTGTMSTWAIFSMMGFYPACPGDLDYVVTSPTFNKVTIRLDEKFYPKGELVIESARKTPEDIYIKEVTAGGKKLKGYTISQDELVNAGTLRFTLENKH